MRNLLHNHPSLDLDLGPGGIPRILTTSAITTVILSHSHIPTFAKDKSIKICDFIIFKLLRVLYTSQSASYQLQQNLKL